MKTFLFHYENRQYLTENENQMDAEEKFWEEFGEEAEEVEEVEDVDRFIYNFDDSNVIYS